MRYSLRLSEHLNREIIDQVRRRWQPGAKLRGHGTGRYKYIGKKYSEKPITGQRDAIVLRHAARHRYSSRSISGGFTRLSLRLRSSVSKVSAQDYRNLRAVTKLGAAVREDGKRWQKGSTYQVKDADTIS